MATHEGELLSAMKSAMTRRGLAGSRSRQVAGKSTKIDHRCRRKMVQGDHLGNFFVAGEITAAAALVHPGVDADGREVRNQRQAQPDVAHPLRPFRRLSH